MMWGLDPRVTLASLAHPGLNSVAAPRLIDAFFQRGAKRSQNILMQRDRLANISQGLFPRFPLAYTTGKARHLRHDIPVFARIQNNSSGHRPDFITTIASSPATKLVMDIEPSDRHAVSLSESLRPCQVYNSA